MSIEKRRFIRFSLDFSAIRYKSKGEAVQTIIRDVSVGGCLAEWDENLYPGMEFRIEIELPNKNRLPLLCRALYRFQGRGIGTKFVGMSQFEQELLGQTISQVLENEGMAFAVDPFAIPPTYVSQAEEVISTDN